MVTEVLLALKAPLAPEVNRVTEVLLELQESVDLVGFKVSLDLVDFKVSLAHQVLLARTVKMVLLLHL